MIIGSLLRDEVKYVLLAFVRYLAFGSPCLVLPRLNYSEPHVHYTRKKREQENNDMPFGREENGRKTSLWCFLLRGSSVSLMCLLEHRFALFFPKPLRRNRENGEQNKKSLLLPFG